MKLKLLLTLHFIFSIIILVIAQEPTTFPQDTTTVTQDTITPPQQDENYVYMSIELSNEEKAKVDFLISKISPDEIEEFKNKYDLWLTSTQAPELQLYSSVEPYKTEEFYDFKDYTLGLGEEYIGLIIDFYQDNYSGLSHYILLDISFEDYGYLLDEVRTEIHTPQYTEDGKKIYYSAHYSFANLYFKKILSLIEINGNNFAITSINPINNSKKNDLVFYPNPVRNKLNVKFSLSKSNFVSLKIIDILGNEVKIINNNKFYPEGQYSVSWLRNNEVTNGIYLLVFKTKDSKLIRKFIVND